MMFSPVNLNALIIDPLRYYFSTYTSGSTFFWDPDEKKRTIEIDATNNLHKIAFNERPRILVDRGNYMVPKTALTDNMSSAKTMNQTFGLQDIENFVMYQGQAEVIIETTQLGSCEIVVDMAQHFILWSRPYLCGSQGFKDFASTLSVSSCELDSSTEGKEKFRCTITIPWMREERWSVKNDSIKIKDFALSLNPGA